MPQRTTADPVAVRAARIIIVEDEPMIALDLEDVLTTEGFEVVGVATRLDKALSMIAHTVFDAAILDANLGGQSSDPAAAELTARKLPFVVLSGYSMKQKQELFPGAHFIQKPCKPAHLVAALHSILSARSV